MKTYKDLDGLFKDIWDKKFKKPSRSQIQEMRDRKIISSPRGLSERTPGEFSFPDLIGIYFSLALSRHGFGIEDTITMTRDFYKKLEDELGAKNIDPNFVIKKEASLRGLKCFIQDRKSYCFVHGRPNMEIFVRTEGDKTKHVWNLVGINVGEILHLLAKRWVKEE